MKTLVLASLGDTLAFPNVAAQMRRLFGPRGYASRQDNLVAQDMDTAPAEEDFEAWLAYRKAKRAQKENGDHGSREKSKSSGEGRSKNAINRRTGERNRCYTCNIEYHYAPQRPQEETRYGGAPSPQRRSKKPPKKPYSPSAIETPVVVGSLPKLAPEGPARSRGNSLTATIELGGAICGHPIGERGRVGYWSDGEFGLLRMVGKTIIRFRGKQGFAKAVPYPSAARFKFGGEGIGEARSGYQGGRCGLQGRPHGLCAGA